MTNDEMFKLILDELKDLKQGQAKLEQGQMKLEQGQTKLEQGQQCLQNDISIIKEETAITRNAVNVLLKWAEKADKIINVGLYQD